MFTIKPEYQPAVVEALCQHEGLPFAPGCFAVFRQDDGQQTGWAVFWMDNYKVEVRGLSHCPPDQADLLLRAGLHAARCRACTAFWFSQSFWQQRSEQLAPLGYQMQETAMDEFFRPCSSCPPQ